jgi:glycopeptide antibiotics resistance protein
MRYIADLLPSAPMLILVSASLYFVLYQTLKKKREKPGFMKIFAEFTLTGWLVVSVYITQIMGFGNGEGEVFNIRPLHIFYIAFRYGSNNAGMVWQFLLNILMFVPLGFLLPIVFPKTCASWPRVLLVSFCTTFTAELLQIFTQRGTDIDDVIANTAGSLCGFALFTLLPIVPNFTKFGTIETPHWRKKAAIAAMVLLVVTAPFVAVMVADGHSEYGNLYYGHQQPRYVRLDGNVSKEAVTRAVYKYVPHTDIHILQERLMAAGGFHGSFEQDASGGWYLNDGEDKSISISPYQTWRVYDPARTNDTQVPGVVLDENEALIRAWAYLNLFGITPDIVRYEATQSRIDEGGCYLVFSSLESEPNQMIIGGVSLFLTAGGAPISISDGRIWGEYVQNTDCISPSEAIEIARDVGVGEWNGIAYISSVESDYAFIDDTGYLIPTWKINARFIAQSGDEYDWMPMIDAVK